MATQTLYFRNLASTLVSGTASVQQLSTTIGTTLAASACSVAHSSAATIQFTPATVNNVTLFTPTTTPNSKGWIFDGSAAGTYASGTWTFTFEGVQGTTSATVIEKISLWVVTYTTTVVTSVSQLANATGSTSSAASTTAADRTVSLVLGTVTLAANQALYAEVYSTFSTTSVGYSDKIYLDDPTSASATKLLTTNFTAGGSAPVVNTTPSKFQLLNLIH